MQVQDLIKDIETKYPVEKIKVNGIQYWPFLKIFIFDQLYVSGGTRVKLPLSTKLKLVLANFYGFLNWFKKVDVLVFSNSDQRKELGGKWVDKSADFIGLNVKNALTIELPVFEHKTQRTLVFSRIVSHMPLRLLEKFLGKKTSFEGLDIANQISAECNVSISAESIGKRFMAQKEVMDKLLSWKKPKAIFMAVPYMKMGAVYSSNLRGVPVVEMQHGTINASHFGYAHYKDFDSNLFPKYLLSYGCAQVDLFKGLKLFQAENVYPLGHYFLYLKSIEQSDKLNAYKNRLSNYEKVIGVSLQDDATGEKLPSFLKEVATEHPEWAFIFAPRKKSAQHYTKYELPNNVIFFEGLNIYEVIQLSDIHTTVFSTCALEAPALGVPNLLVNLDGKAREYFSQLLPEGMSNKYANTTSDYISCVKGEWADTSEVMKSNEWNIADSFDERLKSFLSKFEEEEKIQIT